MILRLVVPFDVALPWRFDADHEEREWRPENGRGIRSARRVYRCTVHHDTWLEAILASYSFNGMEGQLRLGTSSHASVGHSC